jgi:hypothetical protein
MDKKTIERYLRIYPDIDKEIDRLETELNDIQEKIKKYKNSSNTFSVSALNTFQSAYDSCSEELCNAITARVAIRKAYYALKPTQKGIIAYRFWQNRRIRWVDVAQEFQYSRKHVEKIYAQFLLKVDTF